MGFQSTINNEILITDNGLYVPLGDKGRVYFNNYWLRDNCPTSFNIKTRERVFDIFHLETAPIAQNAFLDSQALVIEWQNEHHISRIPLTTLHAYASGKRRPDPADIPRQAWYGDHFSEVARFTYDEIQSDKSKLLAWIKAMIVEGVSIVNEMPDSDDALTSLVKKMGTVRPTFFGDYFDVRTHINPTNTAFTASALELHTDVPAEEQAPGIQFLHMRANSVEGGLNLFGDGVAAANDFREIDPEGFRLLSETDIPFFCEHDTYDMRAYHRVIELDKHGEVSGLTISQHMLDFIDLPQEFLDQYYPAFCRFGRLLQSDKYIMKFSLKATECIVFDNHRIVHGRAAYSANSGERYLRGTYADRAEMRSTYRALLSEGGRSSYFKAA
ncbi:TauD/TfdA family dioxygenase [Curvivirga sp.]|uniref:TauD/TfdA family dioxygenase n=1 Tax=Curvivirga sp. TaxID=2856848 RepID=UPI003B5C32F3